MSQNEIPYRDFWLDAVFISHYCPSLGNPFDLTLAQWNAVLDRIEDLKEDITPPKSHEQAALSMTFNARRLEKRKRAYYGR